MSNDKTEREPQEGSGKTEEQLTAARAEVEALQAEVTELRQQASSDTEERKGARRQQWRWWIVALLIILGSIVGAGANLAMWMRAVVLDTDTWVATVAPLSRNPVVAAAVGDYAVEELFRAVDIEQAVHDVLPEQITVLAAPLVAVLQDFARDIAADVIKSDEFYKIWVGANRLAHEQIVAVLQFDRGVIALSEGRVVLDLSDLLEPILNNPVLSELGLVTSDNLGEIVLYENQQIAAIQGALRLLNQVAFVLPLLVLVAFIAAWWLAPRRRTTLLYIGVAVIATMALFLIALSLAQPIFLGPIAGELARAVAGEIWGIVLHGLVIQTVVILVIGVIIAAGAALAGPQPRAVAIRTGVRNWASNLTDRSRSQNGQSVSENDAQEEGGS